MRERERGREREHMFKAACNLIKLFAHIVSSHELYSDLMTLLEGKHLAEDVFKIVAAKDNVWVGNLNYFTPRVHPMYDMIICVYMFT